MELREEREQQNRARCSVAAHGAQGRETGLRACRMQLPEKTEPYRQQILDLLASCKGISCESMRTARRAEQLSYQALTAFCREQGIGAKRRSLPQASTISSPAWKCGTTARRMK